MGVQGIGPPTPVPAPLFPIQEEKGLPPMGQIKTTASEWGTEKRGGGRGADAQGVGDVCEPVTEVKV